MNAFGVKRGRGQLKKTNKSYGELAVNEVRKLTVNDILKQAGGLDAVTTVGLNSGNKYLIYAEDTVDEQFCIWGPLELGKFFQPYQIDQNNNFDIFGNMFRITKRQIDDAF